jgi:transcriptional regulator
MYDISYFKAKEYQEVFDFMQAHPFVTICGVDEKGLPVATHIPVLIKTVGETVVISGHLMRKQDHTNAFEIHADVLVIFSAPSAFVSASWYSSPGQASTWNYQTVHAIGKMELQDEQHLHALLTELTEKFEQDPNAPSQVKNLDPMYMHQNMKAIVSFEMKVTALKHVFKLSQNRDEVSHQNIQTELNKGDAACKYMAAAMSKNK